MSIEDRRCRESAACGAGIGYQLYLPPGYEPLSGRRWPLILFLHGIKKRGDDLRMLDGYGLAWIAERERRRDFVIAAPQCPPGLFWPAVRDRLEALLDEIVGECAIDPERVYLTGFSMGGNGTWDLAARSPRRFAAAAPLSGWYDPSAASLLRSLPIWAFHGEDDDVVPFERTAEMVEALARAGGDVRLTAYAGLKHPIMEEAYGRPALYEWLLRHRRRPAPSN